MRIARLVPALCLAAFLPSLPSLGAPELPDVPVAIQSRIDAVTVYLDRALVSRSASVQVAAGPRRLVFAGLPSEIEDGSLRVKLSGPARLETLQVRKTFLSERKPGAAQALEAELKALAEQIQEQRDVLAVLQGARGFLDTIQVSRTERISKELGRDEGSGPDVEKYRAVLAFLTEGRLDAAAKVRKAVSAISELEPRLSARQKELDQLRSDASLEQKEVTAVLQAEAPGAVEITLSYMLPGAMWFPSYDVRAQSGLDTVEMSYHAVIQQATGEDWRDAVLTLSAARPAVQVAPPQPHPWILALGGEQLMAQQQEEDGSWDPCSNLKSQYAQRSVGNRKAHQQLLENSLQVKLVSESTEKRSSSAVFRVPRHESVASDGMPHRVTLAVATLDMARTWHAVPRQSMNVYVTGRVTNGSGLALLPGPANIFIGTDLIGSSAMGFTAPRETAEIYLGVDETVKVTRELDNRESSKTFFSKRKRLEVAYTITVENLRTGPADVSIHEALPVSQDERVSVSSGSIKPRPEEEERGLLRWDLHLQPGESRDLRFAYTVEYPSDLQVPQVEALEQAVRMKK